jgi:sulfonate transport system substrate-binding protein
VLDGLPYRIGWHNFPAGAPVMEALNAGAVDVGIASDAPFLFAFANGAPVKAISASKFEGSGNAIIVPKDSPIHRPVDLKGHTIAAIRGSIGQYLVLRAAETAGLQASDVKIAYLLPSDAKAALAAGSVDGWAIWDPYRAIGVAEDGDRVIITGKDLLPNLVYIMAGDKAIAAKRPLLADFVARMARARQWEDTHLDEYAKACSAETGLQLDIARQTLDAQRSLSIPIDAGIVALQQQEADYYLASGVIRNHVDVAAGFDASFNNSLEIK